mmetsp:Transcript_138331/g.240525  ORF Transcript_138331/g.240525 Transcript_138331/m.240525 type:complete len:214 (-) Transcript_138331:566-1207(-)
MGSSTSWAPLTLVSACSWQTVLRRSTSSGTLRATTTSRRPRPAPTSACGEETSPHKSTPFGMPGLPLRVFSRRRSSGHTLRPAPPAAALSPRSIWSSFPPSPGPWRRPCTSLDGPGPLGCPPSWTLALPPRAPPSQRCPPRCGCLLPASWSVRSAVSGGASTSAMGAGPSGRSSRSSPALTSPRLSTTRTCSTRMSVSRTPTATSALSSSWSG